jgi:hypothetical protein
VTALVIPLAPGLVFDGAADAFLARRDLDADTVRSCAQTITRLRRELGGTAVLADLAPEAVAGVFAAA